jgi:hypothetical protein
MLTWIGVASLALLILGQRRINASSDSVSKQIVNLGTQLPSQTITKQLRVKNSGSRALMFTLLKTSCGCLSAKVFPETLAPGAAATLSMRVVTHSLPGQASISALLIGQQGNKKYASEYIIKYNVQPMILISLPGAKLISPTIIDLGRRKQQSLKHPIRINVRRGSFPAEWNVLKCSCIEHGVTVTTHRVGPDNWTLRLLFSNQHLFGEHTYLLRFTFINHGKLLSYRLIEPVEINITGFLSLVPSSLLIGTLKPGKEFAHTITLWSRDASVAPKVLRATCTTPTHMTVRIVRGGSAVHIVFDPKMKRGPIAGKIKFLLLYGSKKIKLNEDYFAYILKRHGEPIPKQVPR